MRDSMLLLSLVMLVAGSEPLHAADAPISRVTFYAMGDVPYAPADDKRLPQQVTGIPDDAEFVIHVGDIKSGGAPCDESVYIKVAGMLSRSAAPVFIIPGDNEWNDCTEPAQAWTYWTRHFMRYDSNWQHGFPLFRQLEHEENFSFVRNGVLFVGLNVVGGTVLDADEWKQRHADGIIWIQRNLRKFGKDIGSMVVFGHAQLISKHDDFIAAFCTTAESFGKPVLYLHGDGHKWKHDHPFAAKNILRVQVDQGGSAPPLKVTVTDDSSQPFQFDRRNGQSVP